MNEIQTNESSLNVHIRLARASGGKNINYIKQVIQAILSKVRLKAEIQGKNEKEIKEVCGKTEENFWSSFAATVPLVKERFAKKRILPLYTSMNAYLVLIYFIDAQIKKYHVICPEDSTFHTTCEKFYEDSAELSSFYKGEEKKANVKNFLDNLQNKLKAAADWDEIEDVKDFQLCEKFLFSDGFLVLHIADFLKITKKVGQDFILETSVSDASNAYYLQAISFYEKSQAFFQKYIEIFKSFNNCPQYPGLLYSEALTEFLIEVSREMEILAKEIIKKEPEDIADCSQKALNLYLKFYALMNVADPHETRPPLSYNYGEANVLENFLKKAKKICEDGDQAALFDISVLKFRPDTLTKNLQEIKRRRHEWTLSQCKKALEFQEKLAEATCQCDGHLYSYVVGMRLTSEALKSWLVEKKMLEIKKIVPKIPAVSSEKPSPASFVVETWMQKEKPQARQTIKQSFTPKKEISLPKEDSPKTTRVEANSVLSPLHQTLSLGFELSKMIRATDISTHRFPKIALKHAQMYAHDLVVIMQRFDTINKENLTEMVSSIETVSYYLMEQMIRYQRLIQQDPFDSKQVFDEHGLKHGWQLLQKKPVVDETALKQLNQAYLWVHSTFGQYQEWFHLNRQWGNEIPQALSLLIRANLPLEREMKTQITVLQSYLKNTLSFVEGFHINRHHSDTKISELGKDIGIFDLENTFDLKKINNFLKEIENIQKKSTNFKLKQVFRDLKIIEQKFIRFHLKSSSLEFSTLVREVSFWQNCLLERLLQIVWELQNKKVCENHQTTELASMIKWTKPLEDKWLKFLSDYFLNLHNTSRYPFEFKVETKTHELILQAEFLREHHELPQGFELPSEDNKISTKVNFIPVKQTDLNPQAILNELSSIFATLLDFSLSHILPEIKGLKL